MQIFRRGEGKRKQTNKTEKRNETKQNEMKNTTNNVNYWWRANKRLKQQTEKHE